MKTFRSFTATLFVLVTMGSTLLLGAAGCALPAEEQDGTDAHGVEGGDNETTAETSQALGYYNYYHDEAKNAGGPNRCSSNWDCDGMRTCSPWGWCQGEARPAMACNSPNYYWNEAWNSQGSNRCSNDCDCDGARTCSPWGWCQGQSR